MDPELIFTKQERIGKGSFGEVFKGIDNRTQQVKFLSLIFKLKPEASIALTCCSRETKTKTFQPICILI